VNTLIFGAVVCVVAGLAVWLGFRYASKAGASEVRADSAEKGMDHAKQALEIEERNRRLDDDAVDRRLFGDK
jgi:hypothetical protein